MANELTTQRKPGTLEQLKTLVDQQKDKLSLWAGTERRARQIADKAMLEIHKNPELLRCTPASLFYAIREAIANGLEIGGLRPHAYLVPFKDKVTLIPSYIGLTELIRRTGNLSHHVLEVVHEGDEFEFSLGDNPHITHKPLDTPDRTKKEVTHVYAIFWMRDGAIHRSVWTKARVDAHKERYSKGWQRSDSPWQTAWEAMAKKTLVRDIVNRGIVAIQERLFEGATSLMDRDEPLDQVINESPALEHHQPALNVEVLPDPVQVNDDLWNRYESALVNAGNLGALTAVTDEFLPLFSSDGDREVAAGLAEKQAARLRQQKSEKANA